MPINQPKSALARADQRVEQARATLQGLLEMLEVAGKSSGHIGTDVRAALDSLTFASAALNFAGNSQQKLIVAARSVSDRWQRICRTRKLTPGEQKEHCALNDAIAHAEGPGID